MASAMILERAILNPKKDLEQNNSKEKKLIPSKRKIDNCAPQLCFTFDSNMSEDDIKQKENEILQLGECFQKEKKAKELGELIKATRPFLNFVSKAKAAKLVRTLVDNFLDMDADIGIEIDLCKECIEWAKQERRAFLRQSLEARLVSLYFDKGHYMEALHLSSALLKELKKLDDKNLLVEVQLLESKTYHALDNLSKARAALTSARTTANTIYCPPKLQAALDLQAGILHAADERDFKTAYSYFYEAFEGYHGINNPRSLCTLKYMLLAKIMLHSPEDVPSILTGKLGLQYAGRDIEAMRSIALASQHRSLADFQKATQEYKVELEHDPIIQKHLTTLYDTMLEQNLCRIIEPYSCVQVDYIARIIKLPHSQVEKKLSQMILDKKCSGILDQGEGVLIVFEDVVRDQTCESALETIQSMSKVVDTLFHRAKQLT